MQHTQLFLKTLTTTVLLLSPFPPPGRQARLTTAWIWRMLVWLGCAGLLAHPSVWAEPAAEGTSQAAQQEAEDWSLHMQLTGIYQGYPSFPARYPDAHSLTRHAQIRETVT